MKRKDLLKKPVAAATVLSLMFGPVATSVTPVYAEEVSSWVVPADLSDAEVEAPEKDAVLPDANQFKYQKDELAAFCHFGPNTFNEIEWGEHYGSQAPSEIFRLEDDFDEEGFVLNIKNAGFKKLIITAKHHDGFCIWDSAFTDYDCAAAGYKGGKGDVLAEVSAACTKYDIDMGLYLSPWDIHEKSYGYYDANGNATSKENDVLDYNDYYNNQLEEILGNPKYGNNGHFVEVWMDGAKGSGANAQEYDFNRWFTTIQNLQGKAAGYDADCMLFGAESYTTVRWIGNEIGIADNETWSKVNIDRDKNTINSNGGGESNATRGFADGNQWCVPEVDARITSGWFWGNNKKTPKSLTDLGNMYFTSVGRGAVLLLNIPPNNKGAVDELIQTRTQEFGKAISDTFRTNLAKSGSATISASQVRGNSTTYSPANLLNEDDQSVWSTNDGTNEGQILIDLGTARSFDVVNIEEAIQFGQRINEWKVEYQKADGTWASMGSGITIGPKRLVRTTPVKASKVRITVKTPEGKVPVLNEIGIYKAAAGIELGQAIPDGTEAIDITDSAFSFTGSWTSESGSQFFNGTNKYSSNGSTTLTFNGSRAWLLGTVDPNHGTADVYVDGTLVKTIDMSATTRALGQRLFDTGDLADGEHTIRVVCKTKATGLEGAIILPAGKTMIGIENKTYTMNEDETLEVKLTRMGDLSKSVTVTASPNPGTAIQDDFFTDLIHTVTFAPNETEKTVTVKTRRNTNKTGEQYFTLELSSADESVALGFNPTATILINDMEAASKESLAVVLAQAKACDTNLYAGGWEALNAAIAQAEALMNQPSPFAEAIDKAESDLKAAMDAMSVRDLYTAEDPFVFPIVEGASTVLEAELSTLHNTGENEQWPLTISSAAWASNGKFVNCLNNGDSIAIPFNAPRAGKYKVTATISSGDPNNSLVWSTEDAENGGQITAGNVVAGDSNPDNIKDVEFEIEVTEPGPGIWVFTAPAKNSPRIDKFTIEATEIVKLHYTLNAAAGEGGSISLDEGTLDENGNLDVVEGTDATFTITPDEGFVIESVTVNGEAANVSADGKLTLSNISEDAEIRVTFVASDLYTDRNPFEFPTGTETKTLEAELCILENTGGDDEQWKLGVDTAGWASGGKFVNCIEVGDKVIVPYTAKAGTYIVTADYRSGSNTNKLVWDEPNGKITAGEVFAGADDGAGQTHTTEEFEVVVTEDGAGRWTFTGPAGKSPQLDKFEIRRKIVYYNVTIADAENGSVTASAETVEEGKNVTLTITPDEGYEIEDVKVNGTSVGAVASYTVRNASEDINVEATFKKSENYSSANPFVFPTEKGAPVTLEAEKAILTNTGGADEEWKLSVAEAGWASGGKFVNCLNENDIVEIPFTAAKAGTYKVTVTFRSGDPNNKYVWDDPNGILAAGEKVAGADDSAQATHTEVFTVTINEPGSGVWTFTGPSTKSAQTDKFEIELIEEKEPEVQKWTVTLDAGTGGTISADKDLEVEDGDSITLTIKADEGYEIDDVLVDGESVGKVETYTIDSVDADTTVKAVFKKTETPITADKTVLQNLYAQAIELPEKDYTAESFATLNDAVNGAKSVLDDENADQAAIDAARDQLQAAINGLSKKQSADTTRLEDLIKQIEAMDSSKYTPESWKTLEDAKDDAKALLGGYLSEKDVTDLITDLTDKIHDLEALSDKTALQAAIDRAKEVKRDEYTAESLHDFQVAFSDAIATNMKPNALQADIDAATEALNTAIDNLVKKPVEEEVDTAALEALINQVKDTALDEYTAETADVFAAALKSAQDVLASEKPTQEAVDSAKTALENAHKGLTKKPVENPDPDKVDKSALEQAVNAWKGKDLSAYTDASAKALQTALADGQSVLDNADATQDDVNAAVTAITKAADALEKKAEPDKPVAKADKSKLQEKYDKYSIAGETSYTAASWKPFAAEMKKAKAVLDNPDATQAEVDSELEALQKAYLALVPVKKDDQKTDQNTKKPTTNNTANTGVEAAPWTLAAAAAALAGFLSRKKRK